MQRRYFIKKGLLKGCGILLTPQLLEKSKEVNFQKDQIKIIDTHLHLWDLQNLQYPWLENRSSPISRNFLPADYKEATANIPIEKMVFVECGRAPEQYLQEVDWVVKKAQEDNRIKGMVAYFPLEKGRMAIPEIEELISRKIVKGIRYGVNKESFTNNDFITGLQLLPKYNLSFDLNISPGLMPEAISLIKKCPETIFIMDHLCNPNIKDKEFSSWKEHMKQLAELENVNCKISGIITKAAKDWQAEDLKPYINHTIQVFGLNRVMFGGDWPVVLLAGTYEEWFSALQLVISDLQLSDKRKFFCTNAERIYRI